MERAKLEEQLAVFGLSEKEIDTYLAVLQYGEATASTVADDSGVSQRYVYNIAEALAERGLVTVNDHVVPKTIRARSPSEAIESLDRRLEALRPALEERYSEISPQTSQFEKVRSKETAVKRLRGMLGEVDREAFVSVPSEVYPDIRGELSAAVDRGALVLLLLGGVDPESAGSDDAAGHASVVRAWEENLPFMITVDNRSSMVGDVDLFAGRHEPDTAAVAMTDVHIAGSVFGAFLGQYWPVASERYVADPGDLPRTYGEFRHAVFEATLHRRAGETVRATVFTESDETLEGRVTDVKQGLVEPRTNDFSVESSLRVAVDGEAVTVGGRGAFIEEYRAEEVELTVAGSDRA